MIKRAVVVGVNDYSVQGISSLGGCVGDARSIYHLLINSFGFDPKQIFYYTDNKASRTNILRALRYITVNGEAGDVAFFYFAGHGARIRADKGKADCDKYYETIIPYSGDYITDYDISNIANSLQPSYVNFTIMLDSCHSGGMHKTDAVQKCTPRSPVLSEQLIRMLVQYLKTVIPCGICIPIGANVLDNNITSCRDKGNGMVDLDEAPNMTLVAQAKSTLISACKFSETAKEDPKLGHGFLTQSFIDLVGKTCFIISYRELAAELISKVGKYVSTLAAGDTQVPQLRGQMNRMDETFLEGWRDCR